MNCTELQELAALHSLGLLAPEEASRLEAELAANPAARTELAGLRDAAAALSLALARPVSPPPELKSRILGRIIGGATPATTGTPEAEDVAPAAGFHFVLHHEGPWRETGTPGFRVKLLSVSRDMGYRVVLGELARGARIPAHDHAGSEQIFVLTGHLQTEGRLLGPGDFLHSEPGTHHRELISPDGCTALLIQKMAGVAQEPV